MKAPHLLSILCILLAFLAGVLGTALFYEHWQHQRERRAWGTIPLRDDQRKQYFHRADAPVQDAVFLDDTTLLYQSDSCLRLRHLTGSAPEVVFAGHTRDIQVFRLSPDRKRVVTTSTDCTLRLWDARSGECLAVSEPVDSTSQPSWTLLQEAVFHPGGKTILTVDMEGYKTWRASDLKLLSRKDSDVLYLSSGLLSPDWKTLCVNNTELEEGFLVVDCKDDSTLDHVGGRVPLSYSPDGKRILAVNHETGTLEIWDANPATMRTQRGILWLASPSVPLRDAAFSQDGEQLVSAHADGTVRVWNARNGAEREILHHNRADRVCFTPNGARIAAWNIGSTEICIFGPFSWGF